MARGGARQNAGRKKGSIDYKTKIIREHAMEVRNQVAAEGETPLEYMLRVMRDTSADEKRRDEMARAAAKFLHPALANVEQTNHTVTDATEVSDAELANIAARGSAGTSPTQGSKTRTH